MGPSASDSSRPPFDAIAARRLREALGMTHAQVAYGIWAAYGVQVTPATVAAWELDEEWPTGTQLAALAGALWCSPADLLSHPSTLREHRLARGLAASDLALRIGMDPADYAEVERSGTWRGSDRQAAALAEALDLPVAALLEVTGHAEQLADLLRRAVSTRWQAYVRPVGKLLPNPRQQVAEVLQELHADYQSTMIASLNWAEGAGAAGSVDAGRSFLADILNHFWERMSGEPGRARRGSG